MIPRKHEIFLNTYDSNHISDMDESAVTLHLYERQFHEKLPLNNDLNDMAKTHKGNISKHNSFIGKLHDSSSKWLKRSRSHESVLQTCTSIVGTLELEKDEKMRVCRLINVFIKWHSGEIMIKMQACLVHIFLYFR